MPHNPILKDLIVTGFASENKKLLAKKMKVSKKLKNNIENVGEIRNDFIDAFKIAYPNFEKESSEKIFDTQIQIYDLLAKMKKIGLELSTVYQDQIDELEYAKRALISKLDDFKELSEDKMDFFKQQFENNLERF